MIGPAEIARRLGFHPGTPATAPLYEANRREFMALSLSMDRRLPPGREAALVQTAIQEALMWANAAIACASPLGAERADAATR